MLNLASSAPQAAFAGIETARSDYYAGRFSTCLAACQEIVAGGGEDREAALVLQARALIRLAQPTQVVETLVVQLPEFESIERRLEAESLLALAYASLNDFLSAKAVISGLKSPDPKVISAQVRDELLYAEGVVAWAEGDLKQCEATLKLSANSSQLIHGRNVILESWIANRRERYPEHVELMLKGTEILQRAEPLDVWTLANSARAICNMAREIYVPHLLSKAEALYSSIPWTSDLAVEQFNAARTLGWAMALQGTDRYFESLRLLHQASSIAPSPAWKVWSLLDRAAMKRYAGELGASSADLFEALDLLKTVNWGETTDVERTGLLYAAELLAPVDTSGAAALLLQFNQIRESFSSRVTLRGDRMLDAAIAYSTGVVQSALKDTRKARHFLESAYPVYEEIGYKWRAARTALLLYSVTQDQAWHESARKQVRDFPNSWIAADVREASTGIGDDGWNRLTPRQREVFAALCEGMTAKSIGDRLKCSPNTVRNHIHWVYQAFRVNSQPELITEARKRKLIS
jgi:DNA-binding CsgD family transcriptional regulator/tetratricopeptide (TPR) repeat protein